MALKDITLPVVADIIKETKIGQGLTFLPRTNAGLLSKLDLLLEELEAIGDTRVRNEIAGILEELRQRGGISMARYMEIKNENNIM